MAAHLAVLFFFSPFGELRLCAQPTELANYGVDFWREGDGVPQSRVRQIVQSRDGYLWLGTVGGLVRFDGARFTSFGVQTGSLRDNEVWSVRADRDGSLWIGTVTGGLTHFKDGQFTTFTERDGLPDDVIRHIDFDREGNLWLATLRGISVRKNGVFRTLGKKDGLIHDSVTRLCASASDGIFAVAGDRLHHFVDGRFVLTEGIVEPADGRPLALTSTRDGALWICCEAGIAKRVLGGKTTPFQLEQRLGARNAVIYQDSHGTVWMGARDGLRRLEGDTFRLFVPRGAGGRLDAITAISEDREGSLWLGLETDGLARLRHAQFFTLAQEDGLSDVTLRSVYEDHQHDLWMGTAGGFARYHAGHFTNFTALNGVLLPWVNGFAEDAQGTLWIAAAGDLLWLRGETVSAVPGWKHTNDIKSLYRDPQDRIWAGTDGDGVFRFDGENVTTLRTRDGLASDNVRGILCDRTGAMWFATFGGGVSRYADGSFTTFTTKQGLGSDRVVTVQETADGTLWFGTRGGVTRYRNGHFHNFSTREGLPANFVSAIVDDRRGHLWFSCDDGIFQVSLADFENVAAGRTTLLKPVAFGAKDGMRSAAFMAGVQPSGACTSDGRLLFPSLRGLVVIDPTKLFSNSLVPPVHIERVVINDRSLPVDHRAVIAPGDGKIQVDYTALSFLAPEKVRFRYRLEGIDRDWIEAGARRFAYYANLPAGNYTFHVIACNNDGIWNEQGASFAFQIQPHFYRTPWFYALGGFVLIVGPFLGYWLRLRRLNARQVELQQKITEAVAKVRVLSGMLPICASCKQVRDDRGYWNQIEVYIREHSDTQITHGICPDCVKRLYPDYIPAEPAQPDAAGKAPDQRSE